MKNALLVLLSFPVVLLAQTNTLPQHQSRVNQMNALMQQNTSSLMIYYKGEEVDIKGSKYLHNEYVKGEIWFINGTYVSDEYVYKFDEEKNSVQAKGKDGEEILVDAEKISGCRLIIGDKNVFYFGAAVPGEPDKRRLFQLLYNSDNYRIVKLPYKQLITKEKVFHNDDLAYQFISHHRYFIKKGDGRYHEFKLKKKDILKLFPEKKTFLEKLFDTEPYKERLNDGTFAEIMVKLDKKENN